MPETYDCIRNCNAGRQQENGRENRRKKKNSKCEGKLICLPSLCPPRRYRFITTSSTRRMKEKNLQTSEKVLHISSFFDEGGEAGKKCNKGDFIWNIKKKRKISISVNINPRKRKVFSPYFSRCYIEKSIIHKICSL